MNPSYSNGGPSGSGAPGVKPGVIASGPDPENVPSVEIPSGGDSGLSLGSNKHLFRKPRAGAPNRNMVVNVGGGTSSSSDGSGLKKGIIIAGLAVIVILIVGLVVGMMMSGGNGEDGDDTSAISPTTVREQFNSFYHYLTKNNPNDTKDITVEDLIHTSFYIDKTDLNSTQRDNFLKAFNDELTKFIEVYSETSGGQPLDNIYAYVYTLHKLDEITASGLRNIYNSEGASVAKKRLTDAYQNYDVDNSNSLLDAYILLEQEYLTAFIDSLETGNKSGITNKQEAATQAKNDLRFAAYDELDYLYSEVYDKDLNKGTAK